MSISLLPATVRFEDTLGTDAPAPAAVTVLPAGGALTGLGTAAISYGANGGGWLTATADSAATPATVRLAASSASLAPGTYTATVPVTAHAVNSPRLVDVTFVVTGAAPPPPPPPPPGIVVSVAGNIASCGVQRDEATAALLAGSEVVFTAGDNAFPNGTSTDYTTCYEPSWGRYKSITYATLGNHEYNTGNADAAFDYFGARAGPRGLGYYSIEVGDWHIIVLNDNANYVPFGEDSEQERWLRADLAASTKTCTMALWHQPRFLSSGTAGFTESPLRKTLWDILYAAGADVVVNGHMHHYERMKPMTPDGAVDAARGIRQFNVGTGGESVAMPTVIHPNSEVRSIAYGVLRLTLRRGNYDWTFLPIAGENFSDAGTGTCH